MTNIARRVWEARGDLRTPKLDRRGAEILPAFPEWLARPPRRGHDESREDYERRRADGMQAACAVWMTLAACCDWLSMEVIDPDGGYLSVERLAELAELTIDRTERALRLLRTAQVIAFTKQHREKKPDGKFRSTGPALRKLSVGTFRKLGVIGRYFDGRRETLRRRKERAERDAARAGQGVDQRARELTRNLVTATEHRTHAAPAAPPTIPGAVPEDLKAAIAAEHPDWSFAQILQEGRRRLAGPDSS